MLKFQPLIAGALLTSALLAPLDAHAQPDALYESGHADIAVSLVPGGNDLRVEWKFDNSVVNGEFRTGYWPIESAVAFTSATYQRPASDSAGRFSFLGVQPGESTYYFPSDNGTAVEQKVPFLGWSNEVPAGVLRSDTVEVSLRSVQRVGGGQAQFSIWDIDVLSPRVYISSADGIGAQDKLALVGHSHYFMNLTSTQEPAALIVSMQAAAQKLDGTQLRKNFDLQILSCTPGLNCPQDPGATPAPLMGGCLSGLLAFGLGALGLARRRRTALMAKFKTFTRSGRVGQFAGVLFALGLSSGVFGCGNEGAGDTPAGSSGQGASATPTSMTGGESSSAPATTLGSSAPGIPSGQEPGEPSGSADTTSTSGASSSSSSATTDSSSPDLSSSSDSNSKSTSTGSTSEEPKPKRKEYTFGHGDVAVYYDETNDTLRVAIDVERAIVDGVENVTQEFGIDELLIRSKARLVRPEDESENEFEKLCVEKKESVGWFPEFNQDCTDNRTPFLGWASRIRPRDLKDGFIRIRIDSFTAPQAGGHVSMWKADLPPKFLVSSCDGLDDKDEFLMYSGHEHRNLGFAGAPGLWIVNYAVEVNLKDKPNTYKQTFSLHFWIE